MKITCKPNIWAETLRRERELDRGMVPNLQLKEFTHRRVCKFEIVYNPH